MSRWPFGLLLLLVVSVPRCSQTQPPGEGRHDHSETLPNNSSIELERLESAIFAWKSNRGEGALNHWITAGDVSQLSLGPRQLVLRLTESDVRQLSREERSAFQSEVIEIVPLIRELGFKCIGQGSALLESGNATEAKKYFEAAKRLGETLAAPDRVEVLHSIGKRFIAEGENGLSQCAKTGTD